MDKRTRCVILEYSYTVLSNLPDLDTINSMKP